MPVAVGERPLVEDLELISSGNKVIRCPLEDQAKLGNRLLRGDLFEMLNILAYVMCSFIGS